MKKKSEKKWQTSKKIDKLVQNSENKVKKKWGKWQISEKKVTKIDKLVKKGDKLA